jgi:anti-sigma B factor antagonist
LLSSAAQEHGRGGLPFARLACRFEEEHGLKTATRESGDAIVVDVSGDIDMQHSPALRKVLLETLQRAPRVIVNLQQVKYIDSSGIASLVEGLKESQALKNRLILFGLSKGARDVLKLTHLLPIFEVYETEQQALNA